MAIAHPTHGNWPKPCRMAQIETILRKAVEKRELKHKNLALQTRVQAAEVSA